MNQEKPMRILLSSTAADRIAVDINSILGTRQFELMPAETVSDCVPGDIDIAFISRDVTGLSTKHVLTETLKAFYASLRASPQLQWVHTHSAGADRPIFSELTQRGVKVTTSSGANAEVVAQTALAGLLALAREFPRLFEAQRNHAWASLIGGALPQDLVGQRAVIIGWGPIGQRIASFLRMLDLDVAVVRNSAKPAGKDIRTVVFDDLHKVLSEADWLVLACPLTDQTRQLIDDKALRAMRAGARLVNVARGEVIVENDLIDALRSGRLAGAFLDVFEHEPLAMDSPLWDLGNVIVTPHSAGHSDGNVRRVDQIFLNHLKAWHDTHQ